MKKLMSLYFSVKILEENSVFLAQNLYNKLCNASLKVLSTLLRDA